MKFIEFPEQNAIFAKDQSGYIPLPAHIFKETPDQGRITFCCRLTWRERFLVLWRGVMWHQVLTFNHPLQPQLLSIDKPVMKHE